MPGTTPELSERNRGLVAADGRVFPLRSAAIEACAGGGIARTTLRQLFDNPYDEPLEIIYTMPLPADGAVTGFTIEAGERRIVGEIETRQEAESDYQEALESGRMAGILRQERADTFTQRLGNIEPRTSVRAEIEVLHPLAFRSSAPGPAEWEYRFPTVVGVRYEGEAGRVPDSAALDVDRADVHGVPARMQFALRILDGGPAEIGPRSSSHGIHISPTPLSAAVAHAAPESAASIIGFEEPSRLNRDVVVRWRATSSDVGLRLTEGMGLAGDSGRYALLTLVPPSQPEATFPRDLVLLMDASGSMWGEPLRIARDLAKTLIRALGPGDQFEILSFASGARSLLGGSRDATPQEMAEALRAIDSLEASGGTEMANAIQAALRTARDGAQRQVVLLTDGYIGFESEVVKGVLEGLPENSRLHAVGIGSAPNRALTRAASRAGRGLELVITKADSLDDAAAELLAATSAPVLTGVRINGSAVRTVAPARPNDLFAGRPLVVALELEPDGGTVTVEGQLGGCRFASDGHDHEGDRHWVRTLRLPPEAAPPPRNAAPDGPATAGTVERTGLPVGACFGREAIEDEEMRLASSGYGVGGPILDRIEALGLRHRIPSRCTSLVAIAGEATLDPRKPGRRERLPVEMPAEVSAAGTGTTPISVCGYIMQDQLEAPKVNRRRAARLPEGAALSAPGRSRRARVLGPHAPAAFPWQLDTIEVDHARIDGERLVLTFRSPPEGFRAPAHDTQVRVVISGHPPFTALVDAATGTEPGLWAAGLALRLVLQSSGGAPWVSGEYEIAWLSDNRPVRIRFTVA